ncbi:MAG: LuxR C-terminal-related transcriptional regulator [Nostoc sp. EfeVER01]|uniref:LuxR C-terminal-related transcriptional regulator n=1 Tax=unclassified Nostoc TaxID=2593658 RepID=UPI002AD43D5C|nr:MULTISPECIES: LuxR C-terminal-related transcriptional regulator [unclassified Nostoc]MDZ7948623.1 LuxR C-terminal-related transcriptional regulator [Nostoc sp. EfeVER01]MDZ7991100.1 LuxR C-terminal-related transcriptional regulator [Nostoc sp. EspVER01]
MVALQALFHGIAQAQDEQTLRSHISAEMSEYFSATRCGLFFFAQISLVDKALQIALSPQHNPVARYLLERHAPVHEALVVEPKTWKLICPRADHWHVMAGPIVNNGELVGVVGLTRQQGMPAFNSQNLTDLSALCLHISTWVAMARLQQPLLQTKRLTPREMQIASLVAQGQTNAEISAELWITENSVKQALKRMFRKLEVSSRAHMVAKLSTVSK